MTNLCLAIDNILSKVDFNSIWQDFFKFDFALYNQDNVYFKDKTIPWDKRFLGNTAIDFDGRIIAIWSVSSPETEDHEFLAADIVHEMFHAYQKLKGETRFPNDLELLAYPDNLDNFRCKMVENELLAKAFSENSILALRQFICIRKVRGYLINDFILQEYRAETLEGMAEYAGLAALEQVNKDKFSTRIKEHLSLLANPKNLIFNPRRLAYYTGAILCHTLKSLNVDFYHELSEKRTLFEIINKINDIGIDFDKFMETKRAKFDNFLKCHSEKHNSDSYICGYDPMNMIRLENKILCEHFVILGDEFIQGPVMVILREGTLNHAESYIK